MRLGLPAPKTKAGSQSGRTILLRGDMDALPMPEETGLEFASEIPGCMHACGHDSYTAMLVQAVHLLHRYRDELPGTVKFTFQPGEEGHAGARHMIEDGLLDADPKPDAARPVNGRIVTAAPADPSQLCRQDRRFERPFYSSRPDDDGRFQPPYSTLCRPPAVGPKAG
jgi:hypothetical protein